jgi:hypothetical protein
LTTKLPFEDDEFDHVHIQSIAKGVPENKASLESYACVTPNNLHGFSGELFLREVRMERTMGDSDVSTGG